MERFVDRCKRPVECEVAPEPIDCSWPGASAGWLLLSYPAAALMPVVFTSALGVSDDLVNMALPFGEQIWGVSQTPQVWLDNQVMERGGGLSINSILRPGCAERRPFVNLRRSRAIASTSVLPPSEVAVHPSDENDMHEFYLMTDDLDAEMAALKRAGAACEDTSQQAWGRLTRIKLPGGGTLGLYQPRHERP